MLAVGAIRSRKRAPSSIPPTLRSVNSKTPRYWTATAEKAIYKTPSEPPRYIHHGPVAKESKASSKMIALTIRSRIKKLVPVIKFNCEVAKLLFE